VPLHTLSCNQVSKTFFSAQTKIQIFKNMNYSFRSDRSYALMGPSGIGKSTLLAMMAGIDHVSSGTIQLDDFLISQESFDKRIKFLQKNISMVFQQPCLIAELNVLENVMLKSIIQESMTLQNKEQALILLKDVGLEDKALSFAHTLSGGQQQKVAILRSILHAPKFLLTDEPTGNLDQQSSKQIISLLLSYQKKYAMGLIISTHDILVAKQCDVILNIENHQLTEF
jgi:ABC-type lipoprotein export system ATPase subunit